jgi:hypothetical protein
MTYKELLQLLAQKNRQGGMAQNLYKGVYDFFRGGSSSYPQYPSKVYPEKPKSPWGNPELGNPNRYTQALIPISDTLSFTDGSRTMIYDSSTGEIYPATDYQSPKERAYPQYPSKVYPEKNLPTEPPVSMGGQKPTITGYKHWSSGGRGRWERDRDTGKMVWNGLEPIYAESPGGVNQAQQLNRLQEQRAQRRRDFNPVY